MKRSLKYFRILPLNYLVVVIGLIFLTFLSEGAFGQANGRIERWFNEARQQLALQSYENAKNLCHRILEREPDFLDANLLLADIYHATDSTQQEIIQLEKAAVKSEMPHIRYRLGEANYATGKYADALKNYGKYLQTVDGSSGRSKEIERKMENCRFAIEAKKHPVEFQPERLSDNVNTANDEYWPNLSIDQQELVFTRLVKRPGSFPQEDFYISQFDSGGWSKAQPIVDINTPENEGAQVISADGRLLFFTACNRPAGKGSCDIYFSRWVGGKWSAPRNAGDIVNSSYWEAQPAFSSDNRYLYFSSNRPGGRGNKDIWSAEFKGFDENGNTRFGTPVNLGEIINTKGNEISPFVHPNNKNFYFASDYLTGMGGSDVFMSEIKGDTAFSEPKNMGYPLNTFNNEQGLFISADGLQGYFSSARNEETGLDIYSFQLDEDIRPEPVTYLFARVIDAQTKEPLQANLELVNLTDETAKKRMETTGREGEVVVVLPVGAAYAFSVSKEGYLFFSESFTLTDVNTLYDPYNLLIELKPIEVGSEMNLYNVYFETDSFKILPQSEPELQKLAGFLERNPGLKVEIQGHTDGTGSAEFNKILSEKRAQSVVNYLVENGIHSQRLNSAGFGESNPVATNETEAGRRLNRRTTIKIVGK